MTPEIPNLEGPAGLVAILMVTGRALKLVPWLPDKMLPIVLVLIGGLLNCWRTEFTYNSMVLGFTLGAWAVWGHQAVFKQLLEKEK